MQDSRSREPRGKHTVPERGRKKSQGKGEREEDETECENCQGRNTSFRRCFPSFLSEIFLAPLYDLSFIFQRVA